MISKVTLISSLYVVHQPLPVRAQIQYKARNGGLGQKQLKGVNDAVEPFLWHRDCLMLVTSKLTAVVSFGFG